MSDPCPSSPVANPGNIAMNARAGPAITVTIMPRMRAIPPFRIMALTASTLHNTNIVNSDVADLDRKQAIVTKTNMSAPCHLWRLLALIPCRAASAPTAMASPSSFFCEKMPRYSPVSPTNTLLGETTISNREASAARPQTAATTFMNSSTSKLPAVPIAPTTTNKYIMPCRVVACGLMDHAADNSRKPASPNANIAPIRMLRMRR